MPPKLRFTRRRYREVGCLLILCIIFHKSYPVARKSGVKRDVGRIVFGVNTIQAKRKLITAIGNTWGVGETLVITDCMESEKHPLVMRTLEAPCSEYPPLISWVAVLKEMSKVPAEWYMKVDDDTYVNTLRLRLMLEQIQLAGHESSDFLYLGSFAPGRLHERGNLGLNGEKFAMGGSGILMSRAAIERVAPVLESCMFSPAQSMHSDTQLARCFYLLSPSYTTRRASLINGYGKCFKAFYPKQDINITRPYEDSTVPVSLTERDLEHVTLHSIKSFNLMYNVHRQVQQNLATAESVFRGCK